MNISALKKSILFTAIPALVLLVSTCKSDNSLQSSLAEYDPLLRVAKYISYNLSSSSQVKGVYTLSLSGTQSFDSNFWGWEKGEPQGMLSDYNYTSISTDDTNDIREHYLSNSNKTVNTSHTFNDNVPSGPQYYHTHSTASPFAGGVFPNTGATTGLIRPMPFETIQRSYYNTSEELASDDQLRTYSLTYDESTGLIQSYSILTQVNSTDTTTLATYGFSEDPRSYSNYYVSSYTEKTGSSNTLVGSVTVAIEVDSSANPTETYTYERFDENGDLGEYSLPSDLGFLPSTFFSNANGSTILKIVTTVTTYRSSSGTIAANSVVTVTEKYSSDTDVVFKDETIKEYESSKLHKIASYENRTYNVSGTTETQASQYIATYSDGFLTLEETYASSSGWTTPSSHKEYERDDQGRMTSEKRYSSGTLYLKKVFTFDSSGRTSTIRTYAVDSNGDETCSDSGSSNKDYTYETSDADKVISEVSYSCSGITNSTPSGKVSRTYDSQGKNTKIQYYTYSSSAFLMNDQTTYSYGSNRELLHEQGYSVDGSGQATEAGITEYTYDDNLFLISEITRDSAGDISSNYYVYSYTYK